MITTETLVAYARNGVVVDDEGRYWIGTGAWRRRIGRQAPTFVNIGAYHHSYGPDVAEIFEGWGTSFYPCQRDELELFCARDEGGRYASRTICISKPRQNGKSFGARKYSIWMAAGEGKKVLYSAHNGSTVRKMFRFIRDEVLGTPELFETLNGGKDGIYNSKGSEGIYFRNGGCIEFQTRTSSGALGTTYDIIIVDEAQQLTYDQLDAIKPTTIASDSGDPQMIYVGTPPKPTEPGEVFDDYRKDALAGNGGVWWLEWSVEELPKDMHDTPAVLELAWGTNPAMGLRIREDVMKDAIRSYRRRPDSFAGQYLGWWRPVTKGKVPPIISEGKWERLTVDSAPAKWRKLAFGVKFSLDGKAVALSGCMLCDGSAHVEFLREELCSIGIEWLVTWLVERKGKAAAVSIDGQADAQDLLQRLVEAGMPRAAVMVARPQDAITAAGMFVNAVNDCTITHADDGELSAAVANTRRRKIGRGGGFGFEGELSERTASCALAYWAVRTTKRDPRRRGRIG